MSTLPATLLLLTGLLTTDPAPGRLTIELSTLHVAGLTAARGTSDSSDAPFLLVSILHSQARAGFRFPVRSLPPRRGCGGRPGAAAGARADSW